MDAKCLKATYSGSLLPFILNPKVLGPKYHEYYSIWALKPYYLGPIPYIVP